MYSAVHKWQDLMRAAADSDVLDFTNSSNPLKRPSYKVSLLANTKKYLLVPLEDFIATYYPDTIVFSVRRQLFLQNQSHLPLWNSAKSSKSDSNTLLSPSSSIPLGICLAVTIAGGGKHGNALIVNRLFFTTWEKQHFSTIAQLGRPSCTLVKFTGGTARFSIIIIIYLLAKCYQLRAEPQHISCSYNAGRNLSWAFQSRGQTRDSYCDKNSVFTKCSLPSAKT